MTKTAWRAAARGAVILRRETGGQSGLPGPTTDTRTCGTTTTPSRASRGRKNRQNSRDAVFVNPNANQKTVDRAVFGTKILWFARSSTGALKKPWFSLSKTYFQAISSVEHVGLLYTPKPKFWRMLKVRHFWSGLQSERRSSIACLGRSFPH